MRICPVWVALCRIERWRKITGEDPREIAVDLCLCGDGRQLRQSLGDTQALVVPENEHFVLHNRTAKGEAELVLLVGLLSDLVERVGGVHLLVAQEFPDVSMNLVGARLDDGIHDGAVAASELRAVRVGLNFELGDRIDGGLDDVGRTVQDVAQVGVVIDAVEQEVVLQRACAVGAEAECGFDARSGFRGSHADAEQGELGVVASVQRKRVDGLAIDYLVRVGSLGFELCLFRRSH